MKCLPPMLTFKMIVIIVVLVGMITKASSLTSTSTTTPTTTTAACAGRTSGYRYLIDALPCGWYFECNGDDYPDMVRCPDGLAFNEDSMKCNLPGGLVCPDDSSTTTSVPTTSTTSPAEELHIKTTSETLVVGVVKHFELVCNETSSGYSDMVLISMKLQHKANGANEFRDVASIAHTHTHMMVSPEAPEVKVKDDLGAEVTGEQTDDSRYIKYKWVYPKDQITGEWKCSVVHFDKYTGDMTKDKTQATITGTEATLPPVIDRVNEMDRSLDTLKANNQMLNGMDDKILSELSSLKKQLGELSVKQEAQDADLATLRQKQGRQTNCSSAKSAFMAVANITDLSTSDPDLMPFDLVTFQTGGGFKDSVFTCEIPGIYSFTARVFTKRRFGFQLVMNSSSSDELEVIADAFTKSQTESSVASLAAVLHLKEGDTVFVRRWKNDHELYSTSYHRKSTMFTGALLRADSCDTLDDDRIGTTHKGNNIPI